MKDHWPVSRFYLTPEMIKLVGLLLILLFVTFQWVAAEIRFKRLADLTENMDRNFCYMQLRVDSISNFIGLSNVAMGERK